uniref:Integral membrane protein 2 n=1 Tax=Macaca fascicularis TaxID=9541 RepID=A0A7N9D9U7_MACFA
MKAEARWRMKEAWMASEGKTEAAGACLKVSSLSQGQEEQPPQHRSKRGGSVGGVCYLSMGMVVLLMGLVFASVYIYRYFFLAQLARDNFFRCGVLYEDSLSSQVRTQMELEEDVKIYLDENYERINVPVPQFGGGDPADIIHDFQRGLTAYHDISLDKCYVIELNTTIVLPPRNFWELLMNVKVRRGLGGCLQRPVPPLPPVSWRLGLRCRKFLCQGLGKQETLLSPGPCTQIGLASAIPLLPHLQSQRPETGFLSVQGCTLGTDSCTCHGSWQHRRRHQAQGGKCLGTSEGPAQGPLEEEGGLAFWVRGWRKA